MNINKKIWTAIRESRQDRMHIPICVLCNQRVLEIDDIESHEKNGAHVKCAEKELTGEVISLCQCALRRRGLAICRICEKPYFADGHVFAGRYA